MLPSLFALSHSFEEFKGDKAQISIGYYTMVKLQDRKTHLYLSSVDFSYSNGSHQQMVRAITKGSLAETYWTIWPLPTQTDIPQGRPVECGGRIRLQHAVTGRWLHSHAIPGHFGSGYEVSCFEGSDSGDFWDLECEDTWTLASAARFKHTDTGFYLSVNASSVHPKEFGGENEVFGSEEAGESAWILGGGIFVDESE
jgi:dolichyl-phosphate-mannose--protein O-mannosyl transferase